MSGFMKTVAAIVIGGLLLIVIVCVLASMITVEGTVEFRPATRTTVTETNWWEAEDE